ncbi:MAG: hypothetical protein A2033_07260 [Bacteroidetes bacterium GWA2_31_9]|nr:MAG: hypothetical protein A2033_07260 [Bacteroidetes bacterium GWA2_31_9]
MYLPSQYIYHDVKELKWYPELKEKYNFPGDFYQASKHKETGNYVFFYTMGVSVLETPFFFIGHFVAGFLGYSQDGFSPPYHLTINFGLLLYLLVGFFLLRKVLLRWFSDKITAIVLLLVCLATNFPQYSAIEAGFTHGYLFFIYCLMLYFTVIWHDNPTLKKSFVIGLIIGFAILIRVTDALIMFIPIFWNCHTKELRKQKIAFFKSQPKHIYIAILATFLMLLPQLIYWNHVTGHLIHQMGSKWHFLNPFFRVLVGWEKGWFIYTPVVLFMVLGLFFMKTKEFRNSVLVFIILNIWVVISWHVWRYGASYSTRALAQCLPVLAFPLGVLITKIYKKKVLIILFSITVSYLTIVNLFQIWQYNKGIIHYDDMNRRYYQAVYLNPSPTPVEMSLLDTDEFLNNENDFKQEIIFKSDSVFILNAEYDTINILFSEKISEHNLLNAKWLKLSVNYKTDYTVWGAYFVAELKNSSGLIKQRSIRLDNVLFKSNLKNTAEFYFNTENANSDDELIIYGKTIMNSKIELTDFKIISYF